MISVSDLPAVNATLNAASALLMATGYYFIRRGDRKTHQRFMLAALSASTLFLISYLTYHFQVGSVRFQGTGALRLVYFSVLLTHTVLAAVIVPLVLITLSRALNERFDQHRRIARWTLPLWFYVSATGVLIYWMLYRL
jgi:uncharacterized membrane protein YozB (DUF420 family)